jgi:hypothetical protein
MLARQITEAFAQGTLNLAQRGNPQQGWDSLPEIQSAKLIRKMGDDSTVRLFCTFTSAMDRARESGRLWQSATAVFSNPQTRWIFDRPEVARDRAAIAAILQERDISQRHGPDADAWFRIGVALGVADPPPAVVGSYAR